MHSDPTPAVDAHGISRAMESSLLHMVMTTFNRVNDWSTARIWLLAMVLAWGSVSSWWVIESNRPVALAVLLVMSAAALGDCVTLSWLPRAGISFGPWAGQWFSLLLPRALATFILPLVAFWLPLTVQLAVVVGLQLLGSWLLWRGAVQEPSTVQLTQQSIALPQWPATAPPLRLLHISDIHLERTGRRERQLLAHVAATQPDLILISGDYVNLSYQSDAHTHHHVSALLSQIDAPYGVFGVLGTPLVDLHPVVAPLIDATQPIQLLRHDVVDLDCDHGRRLTLLGMDCTHHIPTDARKLRDLHASLANDDATILLYHSPELMSQASTHAIDLYLCGHTHGGQVRLPIIGALLTSSQLGRRYVMGHYHERATHLYVSRGVGLEGASAPRVRLLCLPEITLFELHGLA